jgi:hypothetical protein
METQLAERGYTRRCRPRRPEAHLHAADLGDPLLGYRFMPGECIANSRLVEVFRQGKRTQKELDDLKMLVVEVGIDRITQKRELRSFVLFVFS